MLKDKKEQLGSECVELKKQLELWKDGEVIGENLQSRID